MSIFFMFFIIKYDTFFGYGAFEGNDQAISNIEGSLLGCGTPQNYEDVKTY